jgi:hypothetical protein
MAVSKFHPYYLTFLESRWFIGDEGIVGVQILAPDSDPG